MAKASCDVLIMLVLFACHGPPIAAITVAMALPRHTYNVRLAESSAPGNWTAHRQEDGRILSYMQEPTLTYSANGGSVSFVKRQFLENAVCWTDRQYKYTNVAVSGIPVGATFWAGNYQSYPGSSKKVTLTTPVPIEFYFWSTTYWSGEWPSLYPQYATGSRLEWNLNQMPVYKMDVGAGQIVDISIDTSGNQNGHFTGGFAYSDLNSPPTLTYSANGGSVGFVKRRFVENAVCWTDRQYTYTNIAASGIPVGATFWAGNYQSYPGSNKKVTLTTPVPIEFYFWSTTYWSGGWPSLYPQYATGNRLEWNLNQMPVYKMDVGAGQSVDISMDTSGNQNGHFTGGFACSVIPTASPTSSPTSSTTSSPSPAPTQTPTSPTGSPTSSPTSSPSPAPTPDVPTSAKGDPHLVNMHGQRFDLYQVGVHVLIQVPWQAKPADSLLRVEAEARRLGGACADLYFQVVNITGSWTAESGGLQFFANVELDRDDYWRHFGDVDLKVVRGHTASGIAYLNVLVKHLSRVKLPVGGLLGEDDHSAAMTPPPDCGEIVDLYRTHRASFATVEG